MKRLIAYLIAALLSAGISLAQGGGNPLVFDAYVRDFGTVNEADGTLFHTFQFVNGASGTAVISKVTASCSCVTVSYPKARMKGGEAGEISIALSPVGLMGDVLREVFICVEGYDPVKLELRANIVPSKVEINDIYKVSLPSGLRMTTSSASFGYIPQGKSEKKRIDIVNVSDSPLSIQAEVEDAGTLLSVACPERLAAGEAGSIILNYSMPSSSRSLGRHSDEVRLYINGDPCSRLISASAIGIGPLAKKGADCPAFQTYPSRPEVKKSLLGGWNASFSVKNAGKGDLVIRKVQSEGVTSCSLNDGDVIRPGQSRKVSVRSESGSFRIGIVTNDPARPFKEIVP